MEFEYYFENINGWLHIHILPNDLIKGDIFMIPAWLESDVQGSGNYELSSFKEFIENPEIEEDNFGGNACDVFAKRDFTTIQWEWHDKVPDSCTLPTEMLYEILKIWVAKNKELREEKMKNETE